MLSGYAMRLAIYLAVAVATSSACAEDLGEARTQQFDIGAQPLTSALRAYAQQTGEQIVFFSELGKGRQSSPVAGRYTHDAALHKLLENTGLTARRVNERTISIGVLPQHDAAALPPDPAPVHMAQAEVIRPKPAREDEDAAALGGLFDVEEIIVTGTAVQTRTKFESSVAISTFDVHDIAQLSSSSSAELLGAVPGFWVESTAGTTQGNVFARGIIQDGGYRYVALMEDGIAIYPVSELSFYNPDQFVRVDETITRVEALRGGTAPIFAAGAIGGAVNFVTLSPQVPATVFKVGISDYGCYRADVAWSAPLSNGWGLALGGYYRVSDGVREPGYTADEGGQMRMKLARAFEQGELEVFAKYIDDRSLFVVPIALRGNPSKPRAANGADAGTYSLHSEDLARAGLPASAAEVGLRDSRLQDGIHPQLATLGARFSWQFNDTVSMKNLVRYTNGEVRFDGIFSGEAPVSGTDFAAARQVAPAFTVAATGASYPASQLVQNHGHWVVGKEYKALQDDAQLSFGLGAHTLTLGAYLADYSMADRWSLGNQLLMDVSDQPRRLLLAGVTDASGFTQYSTLNLIADYDATAHALYAVDEWQVTDALRLDFGLRYDEQHIDASISEASEVDLDGNPATLYDNATSLAGSERRRVDADFNATGYSLGFNYELTGNQAIFGHYTDSAKLPHFDDVRNGVLMTDNATNIELGYKAATRKLALFATLFQTEFDNVPFQDILANGTTVVRRAQTRTRGLELEGEYRPQQQLNLRFSVTYQSPEYEDYTGASIDNTGNTIRRIPKLMARLMPTYHFHGGRGRLYLSYSYVADRYANDENTITLPSYYELDAGVVVAVSKTLSIQVSGDNLADATGLTEGNPRTNVGTGGIGPVYMARPLFGRSLQAAMMYRF